ncbi:MAG: helix-turn-helix domain-containing protein [Chloroflexota bacterium]|nr:helix-turn-helix domain-containing protein [Chloroflexota bacterium]
MIVERFQRSVEIDWAPAYELLVSLQAFANRSDHSTLELGSEWLKRIRQQIQPELMENISFPTALEYVDAISLLIHQCPVERDAIGFIAWLDALPLGELYERLEPHILRGREELLSDLGAQRTRHVALLTAWNEQYFSHLDPAILAGLKADAEAKRALAASTAPDQLLEIATSGILFSDGDIAETILLVPQYHYRPWNLYSEYRGWRLFHYPVDALPLGAGEPPPHLVRVTRALADPSRLRILRHLAQRPHRFTELVQCSGLSKSTVHHHMVILRAARLVRVHDAGSGPDTYVLRHNALDDLAAQLSTYISAENPTSPGEKHG